LTEAIHIAGKLDRSVLTIVTDAGESHASANGEVLFKLEGTKLSVERLSLVATSVKSKKEKTGHVSISLGHGPKAVTEIRKDGEFKIETELVLHYPLIDKMKGFQPPVEKDQHYFVPYVDTMKGSLRGKFARSPSDLIDSYKESKMTKFELDLELKFAAQEFEWIKEIRLMTEIIMFFWFSFERIIKIQPVFVRSGPDDSSPSGWAFAPMMDSAKCIWKKCCVHFDVLDPVYVDDESYKEIQSYSAAEVTSLRGEVDDPDAIEIFVINEWTNPAAGGGGATWGSGTASAQIVTTDQQLSVPVNQGAINRNHLAHEIGHVLALHHPGVAVAPPMTAAGTANSVMEPSGFYADNPHAQSQDNCDNVSNPLLRLMLVWRARRCIQNPEL
jgi:hypothetical protein